MARKKINMFNQQGALVQSEKLGADAVNVDFNAGNSGMNSTNAEEAIKEAYNHGAVALDDEVTSTSQNGVKSSGIHSFVEEQINAAQSAFTGVKTGHGKNLFDPTSIQNGKIYGTLEDSAAIAYTNNSNYKYVRITVEEGKSYSWKRPQVTGKNNSALCYIVFGSNGTTIITHGYEYDLPLTKEGGRNITIPSGGAILALNVVNADVNAGSNRYDHTDVLMVEEGFHNTEYEPYTPSMVAGNDKPVYTPNEDAYNNRWHIAAKVCFMGDSISTGGMALWPDLMREKYRAKNYLYCGVGGSVWRLYPHNTGTYGKNDTRTKYVYGQIQSLITSIQNGGTKPDVIIIHCGTNDLTNESHPELSVDVTNDTTFANTCGVADLVFGSSGDLSTPTYRYANAVTIVDGTNGCGITLDTSNAPYAGTLIGGIRAACELLWETFPEIRVVLTTPIWKNGASRLKILRVSEQIKRAALYLGCQVIDLTAESGIPMFNVKTWCNDGLHPTEMGARRICDVIGNWLMSHYHIEHYDCTRHTVTINVTSNEEPASGVEVIIKAIAGMLAPTGDNYAWSKQTNGNHSGTTGSDGKYTVLLPNGYYEIVRPSDRYILVDGDKTINITL